MLKKSILILISLLAIMSCELTPESEDVSTVTTTTEFNFVGKTFTNSSGIAIIFLTEDTLKFGDYQWPYTINSTQTAITMDTTATENVITVKKSTSQYGTVVILLYKNDSYYQK